MITEGKRKQVSPGPLRPQLWHSPNSRHSRQPGLFQGEGKDQGSGLFVYRYVHVNPKPWRSCAATESSSLLPPPPPVDKGGGGKKTPQKRQGKEPGRQSGREVVASKASAGRSDKWAGSLLPRTPPRRTPRPPGPGLPEPAAPQAPREASRGTGS